MSGMSVAVAQLFALLLGSLLNGIFFTLFVALFLLLWHSTVPNRFYRNLLLPVGCIMMFLSTAHLILSFIQAVQAFVPKEPEIPTTPNEYYLHFGSSLQTAKTFIFIAQSLLGDGVMIWRCYVIFNGSKIVLLLCLVPLIVNLTFGLLGAVRFLGSRIGLLGQSRVYLSTFISVTLVINLCCSAAIVYRIWRTSKDTESFRKVRPLVGAIVQSGALYATGILALLISYAINSNGVYTILSSVVPLIGIVFSLIALQIHFHLCNPYRHNLNIEQTSNLPTLGTLPRWQHYFSTATEHEQRRCQSGDAQLQFQPHLYSRDDVCVDNVPLSSGGFDARNKEES